MKLQQNTVAPSLSDIAYQYIFNRIVLFELKPNEAIIEDDICRILNISRTPLREALRRLEAEGLVQKARNRGTFVRGFTYEDIIESCDIRKLFELYALKNCVVMVPEQELRSIRNQLESLDKSSPNEDYYKSDAKLHSLIMRFCMNSKMLSYANSLNAQLEMIRSISAQTPNRLASSKLEHIGIADAIIARDHELAHDLLDRHLDNVKDSTLSAFKEMKMAF